MWCGKEEERRRFYARTKDEGLKNKQKKRQVTKERLRSSEIKEPLEGGA